MNSGGQTLSTFVYDWIIIVWMMLGLKLAVNEGKLINYGSEAN